MPRGPVFSRNIRTPSVLHKWTLCSTKAFPPDVVSYERRDSRPVDHILLGEQPRNDLPCARTWARVAWTRGDVLRTGRRVVRGESRSGEPVVLSRQDLPRSRAARAPSFVRDQQSRFGHHW